MISGTSTVDSAAVLAAARRARATAHRVRRGVAMSSSTSTSATTSCAPTIPTLRLAWRTRAVSLCRLHHRTKTHGGWTYTMLEPGVFLWRSPHGCTYLRDHTGTTDLTPPAVEPPDR